MCTLIWVWRAAKGLNRRLNQGGGISWSLPSRRLLSERTLELCHESDFAFVAIITSTLPESDKRRTLNYSRLHKVDSAEGGCPRVNRLHNCLHMDQYTQAAMLGRREAGTSEEEEQKDSRRRARAAQRIGREGGATTRDLVSRPQPSDRFLPVWGGEVMKVKGTWRESKLTYVHRRGLRKHAECWCIYSKWCLQSGPINIWKDELAEAAVCFDRYN